MIPKIGLFGRKEKFTYLAIYMAWILAALFFWKWWINPINFGSPLLFWAVSLAFFYDGTLLPGVFLFYLGKMKKPLEIEAKEVGEVVKKVAVITLTVPGSEDTSIVERELKAISKIEYPHDSWLLVDKKHSPELKALAQKYGVRYFSRQDTKKWGKEKISYWNQPIPPFKAKTKAGNVNAWIDAYGSKYSHFTQFDIDHVPQRNYLDKVLGYFSLPRVAWVQAPSVYGNIRRWTAKGAAEQELVLQGPLQMGFFGTTETPFIIGSHATYSMSAIKEIGGFQPTRAEDHLDTLYLSAKGYRGVFVPEVIAIGDGPENFETYLSQQFAWAYSLIQVFTKHTPKMIWKLKPRVALQFLFTQTWYPLWSLSMLVLFLSPAISLITGQHIAKVGFWEFVYHSLPLSVVSFSAWLWSRKWHNPKSMFLSWRGIALHIARWFVVVNAVVQALLNVKKPYMITKKGGEQKFDFSVSIPYILLSGLMLLVSAASFAFSPNRQILGYMLFSLENVILMFFVAFLPVFMDYKKKTVNFSEIFQNKKEIAISIVSIGLLGELAIFSANDIWLAMRGERVQKKPVFIAAEPLLRPAAFVNQSKPNYYTISAGIGDSPWSLSEKVLNAYITENSLNVKNKSKVIPLIMPRERVRPGSELVFDKEKIKSALAQTP